ncbi:SIMPL domain-containing protein [Cyanobium sp. FGCU-6]|nr:SIMPL domain-containing protein [Cyanobium sp. FGCU6]
MRRVFRLPFLLPLLLAAAGPAGPARGQVQLRCEGTLLEARGSAERRQVARWLRFSLGIEADGSAADTALASLQSRLAAVRSGLQALGAEELRVSSPQTWQRPAEGRRPGRVQAVVQVSGRVAPPRFQELVRGVGSFAGVRLAPVTAEADRAEAETLRRDLLRAAYRDALAQAAEVAAVVGRPQLSPLELQLDGGSPPIALRAAAAPAADAVPPFDPAELEPPLSRLSLLVRFCAR